MCPSVDNDMKREREREWESGRERKMPLDNCSANKTMARRRRLSAGGHRQG